MNQMRLIAAVVPLVVFAAYGQENAASSPAPTAPATTTDAAAQSPAPPPDLEAALRARVQMFFDACSQRKYREAEQLIDEPSRDTFYNANKPMYRSFDEITKIEWSDNFTHASVTVRAGMDMPMQTFVLHAHPLVPTEWRFVDGQWYLHINTPEEGIRMPFFNNPIKIPASQVADANAAPEPLPGGITSVSQKSMREKANELLHGVKADRGFVELESTTAGEQTIRLKNTTPGPVALSLAMEKRPGLEVSLDKKDLGAGEEAVATVRWTPKDKIAKSLCTLHIHVMPMREDIPIQIRFSYNPVQNESASVPK